ncbi:MAG: class I adenylate-forming enzyme family protein [Acidobacteriota bacterium]
MDPFHLLPTACRLRPRAPTIRCAGAALRYDDLRRLAERMVREVQRAGAGAGDRVAALFRNCHLYLACYFGALQGGFVLVPLNLRLHPAEKRGILGHSGSRALVGEPSLMAPLLGEAPRSMEGGWAVAPLDPKDEARDPLMPGDAAHLYYTSGTTGRPKGVVLTRANLAAHVEMTLDELEITERDVWLHAAPMFHLADAWAVWTVTAVAGTHVMLPRYGAAAVLDLLEREGVTITNLVPTMLTELLAEAARRGRKPPSLRLLLSGGAPMPRRAVARVAEVLGCPYAQTYGLTETSPFLTFSLLGARQRRLPVAERLRLLARAGRPARGIRLRVVRFGPRGEMTDVPPDDATVGEVVVRGPTVTPGYWRDPASTREAFRDGWFRTGDLGTLNGDGSLNLVDRAKDVIVTGGETVYSAEVEHLLHDHPAVREAAVFGVPHRVWGESVRAAVVLSAPGAARAEELVAFCRGRIARFKCPRGVDLLPELPRTGSGKIDKKALRAPFWRGRDRGIN